MSKLSTFLLLCIPITVTCCVVPKESGRSAHFVWESRLQTARFPSHRKGADGKLETRLLPYAFTPNRNGSTMSTAVKIYAYNMLSGGEAEKHVLNTRFPRSTWNRDYGVVISAHRHYHVYRVTDSDGGSRDFWFNATDYHGFF